MSESLSRHKFQGEVQSRRVVLVVGRHPGAPSVSDDHLRSEGPVSLIRQPRFPQRAINLPVPDFTPNERTLSGKNCLSG